MSTRKRTETQCVGREVGSKRIKALELDTCSFIIQEATSPTFNPTMVLLRQVFFVNEGRSRYVSVGFYPVYKYQVLLEFGGTWIKLITLTEQHMRTSKEHLPKLCEAMCQGNQYACKDDLFRLQTNGMYVVSRIYLGKQFGFKLVELPYLMNMLHFVRDQKIKYILAQNNVIAYVIAALGWTEFVDPLPTSSNHILYDRLFDELKIALAY